MVDRCSKATGKFYYLIILKTELVVYKNFKDMPKITISAVLLLLRLIVGFLAKAVRLGYSIVDLVDDGVLNNSAARPEWYEHIVQAVSALEDVAAHLSNIEDNLAVNQ